MYCLKCGRETTAEQVFCHSCLDVMQQYPIKPGTAVQLHTRETVKKPVARTKRILSSKEQLQQLRRINKRLLTAVAVLTIALCVATAMLLHNLLGAQQNSLLGKNYQIDTNYPIDTSQAP